MDLQTNGGKPVTSDNADPPDNFRAYSPQIADNGRRPPATAGHLPASNSEFTARVSRCHRLRPGPQWSNPRPRVIRPSVLDPCLRFASATIAIITNWRGARPPRRPANPASLWVRLLSLPVSGLLSLQDPEDFKKRESHPSRLIRVASPCGGNAHQTCTG